MKTTRTIARQIAFQFIFKLEQPGLQAAVNSNELQKEILAHFKHFNVQPEAHDFSLRLILITVQNLPSIDAILIKHLQNWKMERLGVIERALLRMGASELLFFKDVPASVTLDEIIELGKQYGSDDTASFLNGILDPVSKLPEAIAGKILSTPTE